MNIEINSQQEIELVQQAKWEILRSDIYIRDKGICWICNAKVLLKDYDLGHLIDRCNNGRDDYDNVAVMHKRCNNSKPRHLTLEDAMKWKLNRKIPQGKQNEYNNFPLPQNLIKRTNPTSPILLMKRLEDKEVRYNQLLRKVIPATIIWAQGRPQGFPNGLWRILPPPYKSEGIFALHKPPPQVIMPSDNNYSPHNTIQIINGRLEKPIDVMNGHYLMHIEQSTINGKLSVSFTGTNLSNHGDRAHTVGMGVGQISISDWKQAKLKGVSLAEIRDNIVSS
jgi:hypothetical protein